MDGLGRRAAARAARKITDEQVEVLVTRTLTEKGPRPGQPLVDPDDGRRDGPVAVVGLPDLAGLRPQAARRRDLEAQHRPGVHQQGPRRRRPLHEPARARPGPVRRREVADPGPGPHRPVLPMLPTTPERRRTTTSATAPPACSPPTTWPAGQSSPSTTAGTATRSSCGSSSSSTPPSRRTWNCTWSWTTTPPTRHPRSNTGCQAPPVPPALHPNQLRWLNLVERWFAELTNRKLRRSAHRSVTELEPTSASGSTSGTRTPSRSSGPSPPTRSSKPSPPTANASSTQDTVEHRYRRMGSVRGELNPHAPDLHLWPSRAVRFLHSCRSGNYGLCPRTDAHLTYMIDIALTTEFALAAGGMR